MNGFSGLLMTFFIFSFTGWLIELVFRSIYEKRPVNPGFHRGPWLPIYGLTGIMIVLVSGLLSSQAIYLRMVFYFVLSSSVELAAGLFLEHFFGKRYWDYSANRLNILGFVCPLYSFGWVAICLFVEFFLLGYVENLVLSVSDTLKTGINTLLSVLFVFDFLISSGLAREQRGKIGSFVYSIVDDVRKMRR